MATATLAVPPATPHASPKRISPRHSPIPIPDATGRPAVAGTSTSHVNQTLRIGRKLVFNKENSPRTQLKINIPMLLPPRIHVQSASSSWRGSNSAIDDSGSEESEDIDEPTTPRIRVDIVAPRTPGSYLATPGCSPNPFSSCSLPVADELEKELGSMRLSTSRSSRLVLSPCSPAKPPPPLRAPANVLHSPERVGAFQFLRTLNHGTFGTAYTAREVSTGNVVCTKVFHKDAMRDDHIRHSAVSAELASYKRISTADEEARRWLMEIHGVVQDAERIVFVMDLMSSDMFTMIEKNVQKSTLARWIAQIALGIDALHHMGIIHRDIKPENILHVPGNPGRIRITDFTNAWTSPGDCPPLDHKAVYTKTFIGTKEYLAPEVWQRQWYGVMVDWWAVGCLVYDLLVGDVLFADDRAVLAYMKWQRHNTRASFFSSRARYLTAAEIDLIAGLTDALPERRYRLKHLLRHPYFVDRRTGQNVFDEVCGKAPDGNAEAPVVPGIGSVSAAYALSPVAKADPALLDMPLFRPTKIQGTSEDDALFGEFDWINPSGAWGSPVSPR